MTIFVTGPILDTSVTSAASYNILNRFILVVDFLCRSR
jgi:hypothetical protein